MATEDESMTPDKLREIANSPFCVICNQPTYQCDHVQEPSLRMALCAAADEIERLTKERDEWRSLAGSLETYRSQLEEYLCALDGEGARTLMPKLLEVAKAAHAFLACHTFDAMTGEYEPYVPDSDGGRLATALAALEAEVELR